MIPLRQLLLVPAALLALAAPARGAALSGRSDQPASINGKGPVGTAAWPRFSLFGWAGPPLAYTTPTRYAEMANAGFNVTILALNDTGYVVDNLTRLSASRGLGMHNLLLDNRLDSVFIARPATLLLADTIVAAYKKDPGFLGYYLGDEPDSTEFPRIGEWFSILRQRDPNHPSWNSLRGLAGFDSPAAFENYVRGYVTTVRPALLCNSQYDFRAIGDAHLLTQNVSTIATVARENGLPFWGVIQIVQHGPFRYVTDGMIRWQLAQWVAYGARGIGYFCYWTPEPNPEYDWQPAMITDWTCVRTALYDTVRTINAKLEPIGSRLSSSRWLATEYSGSVPAGGSEFTPNSVLASVSGRATLGIFADSTGAPLVFLANSDSLSAQTVTLVPSQRRTVWRLLEDGSAWSPWAGDSQGQVVLTLNPGDFTLLRLSGTVSTLVAGVRDRGPGTLRLGLSPNPARGAVRFSLAGVMPGARLDVLDVSGRRVWSTVCNPGSTEVRWSGEDVRGGRAPAGIYLARLSSAGGAVTRRVAWLGGL